MLLRQETSPFYVIIPLIIILSIDNLILKNPAKRPYLEKLKQEILNGDLDIST